MELSGGDCFTPTLILPPQGGGDEKGVNPLFKGEEMRKELILDRI